MKKKLINYVAIIALIIPAIMVFHSCKDDGDEVFYGKLHMKFEHKVDGNAAVFNQMIYTNLAGNNYSVTEVQWFISDLTLYKKGQSPYVIHRDNIFYHYVDTKVPSTLEWAITDDIPEGAYDSFSFVFGFVPEKNISFSIPNPPEADMWWPPNLGGGYHYMKLNGFWMDTVDFKRGFQFHMGIGREIKGTDTTFTHNHFKVTFNSPVSIIGNKKKEITIAMNIEEWFKNPHTWDFNYWGPGIMDNQTAMKTAKENGQVGVFTLTSIKDL